MTHRTKTKINITFVNICQYIIIIFYETDTNEVKGLYHDDCLEKNNIFCILDWGMAVSCSKNMNFVKKPSDLNERGIVFQCLIIFVFFAHFALGPFF